MTPGTLAILFLLAGFALLVAEMLVPSGGVLGVLSALAFAGCVIVCFRFDSRVGFATLLAMVIAAPFAGMLWVKLWPRTPVGKRMMLAPVSSDLSAAGVTVGQTGVAVSELRPMGMCTFGNDRLEARADHGTIPAGSRVEVVDVIDRRPTVRAM